MKRSTRRQRKPVKTTALARRKPTKLQTALLKAKGDLVRLVETPPPAPSPRMLTDDIDLGTIGLHELITTEKEQLVLSRPAPIDEVRIKPTKDGQVYLSHPTYTRWLNEAFGPLRWQLVPGAKPVKTEEGVVQAFFLHVHGVAVAFCWGEQDYHEKNPEQTYADALEATFASALRRLCKRLGMGLELWDREWTQEFLHTHGVRVTVRWKDGSTHQVWRLRKSRPFWNEVRGEQGEAPRERQQEEDTTRKKGGAWDQKISDKQKIRFWTIARRVGRADTEVKMWLALLGYQHTADITRGDYNYACAKLQAKGPLVSPGEDREPGEEG